MTMLLLASADGGDNISWPGAIVLLGFFLLIAFTSWVYWR